MNKKEVNKLFEDIEKLSFIEQIITITKVVYNNADNINALLCSEEYLPWSSKNIEAINKLFSEGKVKIIQDNIDLPMEEIMKLI